MLMKKYFDGYNTVMVSSEDTGLPFRLFLKSAGVAYKDEPPFLWKEKLSDKTKIPISHNTESECKEWISLNYKLLIKHWNCEISDREMLNMLKKIKSK